MLKTLLVSISACAGLIACATLNKNSSHSSPQIQFTNVTNDVGLKSNASWKYGGPTIADFNDDGIYDFFVSHHDEYPAELWYGSNSGKLVPYGAPIQKGDVHGAAPGDYDNDGDVDLIISVGGGNGTTPRPPRLFRNDNGQFTDVTEGSGIEGLGARGRSVRWIDMDLDGDLDLLHIVARQIPGETGPRNTIFENLGEGKFKFRDSPGVQEIEAERVLVTDFDNDNISDLILFEPLSLWRGTGRFVFENVTQEILPADFESSDFITAAADADFDNDGDRDIYLSRGKTYYQTANNSVDFDAKTGRLDLRDEGNESHDGLSFYASDTIELSRFWHWRRAKGLVLPVFLGVDKTRINTPVEAIDISQEMAEGFPDTIEENGWYLGYLGNDEWRFEWRLNGDLAWDIRATINGVSRVKPDWTPQTYNNVPDVLLENKNGRFTDISDRLPKETHGSNWGVTHGDFDNDGYEDFFVYRFGKLSQRVPDLLLRNRGGQTFEVSTSHMAFVGGIEAHGDMGAAFDYNLDGRIDLLNGDDDRGRWNFYQNKTKNSGNHLLVRLGYSEGYIDPLAATVTVETADGMRQVKDVGSAGAVHSQSLLSTLHFGLGDSDKAVRLKVRWRDGTEKILEDVNANQVIDVGQKRGT